MKSSGISVKKPLKKLLKKNQLLAHFGTKGEAIEKKKKIQI